MMKKIFYAIMLAPSLLAGSRVLADNHDDDFWSGNTGDAINVGKGTLMDTVNNVINTLLGLLGLLATIIILLGGFKWMTSQGNSEKVDEAKNLIKNGIIGLVVIFSAYAIASFVIGQMFTATSE